MKSLIAASFSIALLLAGIAGPGLRRAAAADAPARKNGIPCQESERAHFVARHQFGFCLPRVGWDLEQEDAERGTPGLLLRSRSDPAASIRLQVSAIPASYTGHRRHSEYEEDVVGELLKLDPHPDIRRRLIERREALQLELTAREGDGTRSAKGVILLYVSPAELLRVTLSCPESARGHGPAPAVFERLVTSLVVRGKDPRQEELDELRRMGPR